MDDRRDLDAAGNYVRVVSGSAVVGELVSGSGAWRRGVCGAADVQRERREEFAGSYTVVQHRELRDAVVAVDRHRLGGGGGVFAAWRIASQRGVCGRAGEGLRDG